MNIDRECANDPLALELEGQAGKLVAVFQAWSPPALQAL